MDGDSTGKIIAIVIYHDPADLHQATGAEVIAAFLQIQPAGVHYTI